jgi:hypothetical protein
VKGGHQITQNGNENETIRKQIYGKAENMVVGTSKGKWVKDRQAWTEVTG